ncbi:DivIVA domain-containing protein [Brevibacterium sp. 50QC2O2]|jgi:DivIVA domain-containing protein|uniref:DivIVA domain-containing protein n=1 Tax=Brevibacterium TaxID=1696 RepID=UPI00211BBBD7|nr:MULTISPECIES: DivIVA domain-containing protein [unclassified Brevibacterium]MCQ9367013.1 DivIVA domain-containing protein [Brevibacterium sp. 91QC2O2]MCQ9384162.1 DivIVA domain-containing protein [Brevibacterium sp. 68QC2CO]MCQ9388360.1 DivIVA domain-containing protein [Brevibacterium sp. 50QC2O2]
MALTPEDVVNKRFQHVKFREGYDQDEVDDFLDEVVVELRRLYQENDSLRQKLSEAEAKAAELQKDGGKAAAAPAAPKVEDPQATQAMPAAKPVEEPKKEAAPASPVVAPQAPAAAPAATAPAKPAPEPAKEAKEEPKEEAKSQPAKAAEPKQAEAPAPAANAGGDAAGLIALAQKVHDEHVAEGKKTRDKLIADAKTEASGIVTAAEKKRDDTLNQLETQKSNLERELDVLQNFERQYRTRLKSYLSDQLRELENSSSLAPETLGQAGNAKHSL